jgi:hypothetical protein
MVDDPKVAELKILHIGKSGRPEGRRAGRAITINHFLYTAQCK